MKKFLALLLFLGMLFPFSCNRNKSSEAPPNIILINVDDLGWADPGFMGSAFYETPNIDKLADQGMVFMRGYAGAANCAPSRACLLTGLNTPWHGIYTVASSERGNSRDRMIIPVPNITTLHDSLTTLAEALQVYGYVTCHAGKWHLSDDSRDHGFDYNIGGSHAGHPRSYYPPYGNVDFPEAEQYLTDEIMDHVLDFVDRRTEQPFFLYYAPYAVHTPIHPVDSLQYRFASKPGQEGMSNPDYATMLYNLDRNIGRLREKLVAKDKWENTLVIFTSDNGGLFRISRQKPLRAGKGSYYEGGIRVPFFFTWPGKIKSEINSEIPVHQLDLFPTILDIIGAQLPGKQFDGISLAPLLLEGKNPESRAFFWHFPCYLQQGNVDTRDPLFRTRPGSVVLKDDWKLQQYYEDGSVELFDLKSDPGEQVDLSVVEPGKTAEMLKMLKDWIDETNAPVPVERNPEYAPQSLP